MCLRNTVWRELHALNVGAGLGRVANQRRDLVTWYPATFPFQFLGCNSERTLGQFVRRADTPGHQGERDGDDGGKVPSDVDDGSG